MSFCTHLGQYVIVYTFSPVHPLSIMFILGSFTIMQFHFCQVIIREMDQSHTDMLY